MNYESWHDEDLRRVLIADPEDVDAIIEAAARFVNQPHESEEVHIPFSCNECGNEDTLDIRRAEIL